MMLKSLIHLDVNLMVTVSRKHSWQAREKMIDRRFVGRGENCVFNSLVTQETMQRGNSLLGLLVWVLIDHSF